MKSEPALSDSNLPLLRGTRFALLFVTPNYPAVDVAHKGPMVSVHNSAGSPGLNSSCGSPKDERAPHAQWLESPNHRKLPGGKARRLFPRSAILAAILMLLPHASIAQTSPFTSSNLPIVVINTHGQTIPDDPKIEADMGIIDNGEGNRNNIGDPFNQFNGKIGIEIRGSSSQQFPKLQYGIETRDGSGNAVDVSLLGLPAENDWVLSANYADKSLMRNSLAYNLARSEGRYASRSKYFELVLNGEYQGVYVLFEKIKRTKSRLNISKLASTDVSGDAVTGGYIIKIDRVAIDDSGWYSLYKPYAGATNRTMYLFDYPKPADIVPAQALYIQNYVGTFERVMNSPDFANPTTGYQAYFDLSAAVDYVLLSEITKNVDDYRLSCFMFKERDSKGGKLTAGPAWDYDIAFGNADYYSAYDSAGWNITELPVTLATVDDAFPIPFWWPRLAQDSTFWNAAKERWITLRANQFSLSSIDHFIDSLASYVDEAQERNFERWPILGVHVFANWFVGSTYPQEVQFLKDWVAARVRWMDHNLLSDGTTHGVALNELQVDIDSLTARLDGPVAYIQWDTRSEFNALRFELERRYKFIDGRDTLWRTVASVAAADQGEAAHAYSCIDTLPGIGQFVYRLRIIGKDDQSMFSQETTVQRLLTDVPSSQVPVQFGLSQNFPNPFNPKTSITFSVPRETGVKIEVFNLLGERVTTLVDERKTAGLYTTSFDASSLASGVYLYRMVAGDFACTRKLVVLK